jgi:hypothetical protein
MEFDPVILSLHETGLHKPVTRNPLHVRAKNSKEGQPKILVNGTVKQTLFLFSGCMYIRRSMGQRSTHQSNMYKSNNTLMKSNL